MGYSITIGNAKPFFEKTKYGELIARWGVESATHVDAPEFRNDPSENSNSRSPSYTAWAGFCEETGLHELLLGDDGLMRPHPGTQLLTQSHLDQIQAALVEFRPTVSLTPGFGDWDGKGGPPDWEGRTEKEQYSAANLARLIWLEFWVRWALDNCETPAIENS